MLWFGFLGKFREDMFGDLPRGLMQQIKELAKRFGYCSSKLKQGIGNSLKCGKQIGLVLLRKHEVARPLHA